MPIEDRLELQDERLNKNDERLNLHDERINTLEKRDEEKQKRLKDVEENYEKLEDTVSKENKETRATMREQTEKLFSIVEQAMGYQDSRTTQSHELRMAKLNVMSTVFLKVSAGLAGLGGVAYYIVQHIIEN